MGKLLIILLWSMSVLADDFEGLWISDKIQIHKTVGNRGQDVFTSNLCPNKIYTPLMSDTKYTAKDFIINYNNDRSILVITGKNTCIPTGIYTRLN